MRRAFSYTDRLPQEVDFLELHATGMKMHGFSMRLFEFTAKYVYTGTAQGDTTEVNWVGREFQRDGDLLVGSVKGNIG